MVIKGFKTVVKPTPEIHELKRLIDKWREDSLLLVDSRTVVPDTSNRRHSGLSVDHVHLIASMMLKDGFRSREARFRNAQQGKAAKVQQQQGHDIPLLVRGSLSAPVSVESLSIWRDETAREKGFPRVSIGSGGSVAAGEDHAWFTSLGNGHFMQALNLFHQRAPSVFTQGAGYS